MGAYIRPDKKNQEKSVPTFKGGLTKERGREFSGICYEKKRVHSGKGLPWLECEKKVLQQSPEFMAMI